jgi:hypothetical protein
VFTLQGLGGHCPQTKPIRSNATFAILLALSATTLTADTANIDDNLCVYDVDQEHLFYPDLRFGGVTGFHSTARTSPGIDYYWITEPAFDADFEEFGATWGIPDTSLTKYSSFFPLLLTELGVLEVIHEAYIKAKCPPSGSFSQSVINPLTGQSMGIGGTVFNHYIKTVFPSEN